MIRRRNPWWIVGAGVFGLVCTSGPLNIWTFSVFLRPVTDALHIGRGALDRHAPSPRREKVPA